MVLDEEHPIYGPFFGVMGAASAIIFTCKFIEGLISTTVTHSDSFPFSMNQLLVLLTELQSQELELQQ